MIEEKISEKWVYKENFNICADLLSAIKGGVPLICSGLHLSFERHSGGQRFPTHVHAIADPASKSLGVTVIRIILIIKSNQGRKL
ncbi:MAG: hypothetical protein GU361_06200 [Desulfurococcales archaeon]|nr:hypothetical protein [Desulfurococcales archaeon]